MDDRSRALVDYMNKNIPVLVSATLQGQHGLITDNVKVTSLEDDGYFVTSNGKSYFLTFDNSCKTFDDFRTELLSHLRNYRKFLFNF